MDDDYTRLLNAAYWLVMKATRHNVRTCKKGQEFNQPCTCGLDIRQRVILDLFRKTHPVPTKTPVDGYQRDWRADG